MRIATDVAPVGIVLLAFAFVAGCQAGPKPAANTSGKSAALRTMEHVASNAHRCWFASKDPAFRDYRMADELNSFSGRPRFLLVPAKHPEHKPLLVVQAEGAPPKLEAFGPLMQEALGARIGADVTRWSKGEAGCAGLA